MSNLAIEKQRPWPDMDPKDLQVLTGQQLVH